MTHKLKFSHNIKYLGRTKNEQLLFCSSENEPEWEKAGKGFWLAVDLIPLKGFNP